MNRAARPDCRGRTLAALARRRPATISGFALAALTWPGWGGPGLLIAMALTLGLLNSFDTPLRQSLIGSFVGRRDDLPNALALNAMLFSIGRSIGPPYGFSGQQAVYEPVRGGKLVTGKRSTRREAL